MKTLKIMVFFVLVGVSRVAIAQDPPADLVAALKSDDATKIAAYVTANNINACYGNYSLLAHTIRFNAKKCFDVLIAKNANVNQVCNNYKSPLFFAAEYGQVEMAKVLISKGADNKFKYKDDTLLSCAEKYKRDAMVEYLKNLK